MFSLWIFVLTMLTMNGEGLSANSCVDLQNRVNSLVDLITEMNCKCSGNGLGKKRPAFTATLTKHPTSLTGKVNVKFENVILNRGNNYDPSTGVFTAPISGLYQFSATIMSHGGKDLHLCFYKNQQIVTNLYGAQIHGGSETANPVLELSVGDKVYVQHKENNTQQIIGSSYSYFSGYYISE